MASNYITGTMTVPSSAYGAFDQSKNSPSTGSNAPPVVDSPIDKAYNVFSNALAFKDLSFKDLSGKSLFEDAGSSNSSKYGGHSYSWWRDVLQGPSRDGPSQPQTFDYLDAPWASAYGLSKETAYNEAMTNTEYQRSVKDMQAAGLNPAVIFGAGKGSDAGVPHYISSPSSSGGGGGSGRRSGSNKGNKGDYLLSGSAYSVMSALGGIVGAAATKSAGGYWIGTSLAQGAMHAASSLSKLFR
uniref:DNA pilot protein n=1 Tax=Dulem virus 194 TaxID=3145671 RepID=A0AAU8AVF0_9VIRU